jgi:cholesterol transport system auxiliary component
VRVALEEFSQIFDAPDSSRVLLRASVKLFNADDRITLTERTFTIDKKTPTADAQGAVSALTKASDEFVTEVINWLVDVPRLSQ